MLARSRTECVKAKKHETFSGGIRAAARAPHGARLRAETATWTKVINAASGKVE
jgi:hypothetical protein